MAGAPADLDEASIEASLRGRFGRPCRFYSEVDSTNSRAVAWAREGAPEGAIVVADHQTSGRGRRGRTWISSPGGSLLVSLVLRPETGVARLGLLSLALGVATAEAVESSAGIATSIKWPNDVTVDGRKLAGVLVETSVLGSEARVAVAGVGVNVGGELPAEIEGSATSVVREAARLGLGAPARAELLGALLWAVEENYSRLTEESAARELVERANARFELAGKQVRARFASGETVEGKALAVLPDGGLRLEVEGGARVLHLGEVERLRPRVEA